MNSIERFNQITKQHLEQIYVQADARLSELHKRRYVFSPPIPKDEFYDIRDDIDLWQFEALIDVLNSLSWEDQIIMCVHSAEGPWLIGLLDDEQQTAVKLMMD